jgi:uncharacterized protein YndB with AHSA1/START domain
MTDVPDPLEVAAEVAGSPEEIWELIATGPGISTWFMPAEVDGREGGEIAQRHAPGDDGVARGRITAFEPPRRFVYEEAVGDATMATEFLVEARSGGTCVVRIVTHGLAGVPDDITGGLVAGWTQALATLRIRQAAFAGTPAASDRVWAARPGSLDDAWAELIAGLGLAGVAAGEAVDRTHGDHPAFAGTVEVVQEHGLVLRVTAPDPGVLRLAGTGFGGRTSLVVDRYVYAADPDGAAAEDRRRWERYLKAR